MLFKCDIEISRAKIWFNWLHKWSLAMWEVAHGKIWASYLQAATVNHSSKKLARSNPFRLYLMKKNNW